MVPKLVLINGFHQLFVITLADNLPVRVILRPVIQPLGPGAVLCGPKSQGDGVGVLGTRDRPASKGRALLLVDCFLLASKLLPVSGKFVTGDVFVGWGADGEGEGGGRRGGMMILKHSSSNEP